MIQIAATLTSGFWSEVASGCRAEVSPVVVAAWAAAGLSFHQLLTLQHYLHHCNITCQ
jgi:hypothetical protein